MIHTQYRMFSSSFLTDPSKKLLLGESPWKLGNSTIDKKLVKMDEKNSDKDMIAFFHQIGIEKNANGLATGIDFTFTELWSALHSRNMASIAGMCEGNLRKAFTDFFDALDEEDCEL